MALEEAVPAPQLAPPGRGRDVLPLEDRPHGQAADGVAPLGQFPLDTAIAPAGILLCQLEDETLDLGRDRRAATGRGASAGPLAPDQLAVPLEDRVWPEQQDVLL